jgi:hypothetical protein
VKAVQEILAQQKDCRPSIKSLVFHGLQNHELAFKEKMERLANLVSQILKIWSQDLTSSGEIDALDERAPIVDMMKVSKIFISRVFMRI